MPILHQAIQALRPDKEFTMVDDDPSTIIWNDADVTTPTNAEIKTKFDELKAAELAEANSKATQKTALLEKLGLTEAEAKLLLS